MYVHRDDGDEHVSALACHAQCTGGFGLEALLIIKISAALLGIGFRDLTTMASLLDLRLLVGVLSSICDFWKLNSMIG